MSLVRVASLLLVLVALLYCQSAAGHPYDPHEHQESPFFEGWFLHITTSNNGPTFAVGIGHLPQQSVRNPSAACFLLLNPPSDNAAAATVAANITNLSAKTIPKYLDQQQPRTYTHYFSSLDVHPGKQQAGCIDCPAFVAFGENAGGSCRLEVTGSMVILEAEVPDAFKLLVSNDPNTASILPWGDNPASSPEGWLPGPLLKLHWYVYSMATPVNYKLTLLDTTTPEEPPATANPAAPNMDHQSQQPQPAHRNSSSSTGTINQAPDVTVADGAVVSFSGSGFVHMEKNWGAAFPEQWAWAQGISGDGQSSFVLAGGSLPIKRPSSPWATTAINSLLSTPFPHTTNWRAEPLAFAFSLHSPGVNLTVDPSHPGWVTSFEPCSCCSSMAIKLSGWGHEVVLRVEAQRSSFSALSCPTEDGFAYKSDESFAATAHIRVYGSSTAGSTSAASAAAAAPKTTSRVSAPFGWRGKQRLLLASAVFEGAGLEFGGLFRCAGAGGKGWTGPPWHKLFAQQ